MQVLTATQLLTSFFSFIFKIIKKQKPACASMKWLLSQIGQYKTPTVDCGLRTTDWV